MAIKKITSSAPGLIAWVCAAHVASMLCYAIYPTLLPQLQQEWGASNSAAGLISMFGFGAGFIAPLAFGAVLDAGGGNADPSAWMLAYASLGVLGVFAPMFLRLR